MEEQVLDPGEWLRAFRLHRSVIVVFAVLGLAAGVGYTIAKPDPLTSQALVLLPSASTNSGQAGLNILTEAAIVMSPGVLNSAGKHLSPPLDYSALQHQIGVTGVTSDILQVTAHAQSGTQAEQLANAVATAFVTYTNNGASTLGNTTGALRAETAQIQRQINELQKEIASASALATERAGTSQEAGALQLLSTLQQQQRNATLQLDSVNSQIAQAELTEAADATATVLQPATMATPPSPLRPVTFGLIGLMGGLFLGSVAAWRSIRRNRGLRRRDDIADVVGAPVVASVTLTRRLKSMDWLDLFLHWEPSVEDTWTTRKMLSRWSDGPMVTDVTIITLAKDEAALALAPQLAVSAAAIGIPTTFVDGTDHESASTLRRATASLATNSVSTRANLQVSSGNRADEALSSPSTTLVVTAVVVDPDDVLWESANGTDTTWLALSAGFANGEDLAKVSVAAADRKHRIGGVVVVNPIHDDPTTGRFPSEATDPVIPRPSHLKTGKGAPR